MSKSEQSSLLDPAYGINGDIQNEGETFILYPQRWYIIFLVFLLSYSQSLLWTTFAPVTKETEDYFNTSEVVVNLQYTFGYLVFLPAVPFLGYALIDAQSLKKLFLFSATVSAAGGGIRCITILNPTAPWAIYVLCFGQILNALAGPVVLAGPPKFSSIWMAPHERTLSTAIILCATNFGSAVIFAVGPSLAAKVGYSWYLAIQAIQGALVLILILIYFPAEPETPPSHTAEIEGNTHFSVLDYLEDAKVAFVNPSFLLCTTSYGIIVGALGGWQGMLDDILVPSLSESLVGWLGCASIFAVVSGTLFAGIISSFLHRRHKLCLVVPTIIGALYMAIFTLSFPSVFSNYPIVSSGPLFIGFLIMLTGFSFGMTLPFYYELAVELTYPVSSATATSLLSWLSNGFASAFVMGCTYIHPSYVTSISTGLFFLSSFLLLLIKEEYKRSDVDEGCQT